MAPAENGAQRSWANGVSPCYCIYLARETSFKAWYRCLLAWWQGRQLAGCLVNSIGTAPAFGAHMAYILCYELGANLEMEGNGPFPEHFGTQFVKRLYFTTGVRPANL